MRSIKAAVLEETGLAPPYATSNPLRIESLELEAPGRDEVMVKIRAAGLCHSDLSVINGSRPRPTPMVLGHEAAGVVTETGPGVYGQRREIMLFWYSYRVVVAACPARRADPLYVSRLPLPTATVR